VLALPGAVLADRPPLELAHADVVQELFLDQRYLTALECDLRRLERAAETRMEAGVER
jgi:hypothetical protein